MDGTSSFPTGVSELSKYRSRHSVRSQPPLTLRSTNPPYHRPLSPQYYQGCCPYKHNNTQQSGAQNRSLGHWLLIPIKVGASQISRWRSRQYCTTNPHARKICALVYTIIFPKMCLFTTGFILMLVHHNIPIFFKPEKRGGKMYLEHKG
ncbi:unnamed protein product [Tuber aestivum]|uniref:Uncharacterized protein n=1 Tax=Tuber aestivum TaxID=59557 RepID=A0A292PM20_9PEZI|nr:unnamed protein product [Tuber aestivum]